MRIALVGDALVLTSTLKVEEIELLKKYKPDALKIKDAEGNDVFAIAYKDGCPGINNKGITFSGESRDGNGYATLTANLDLNEGEDPKEAVADIIGTPAVKVNEIEAAAPAALAEVLAARAALIDSITVL